MGRHRRSVLIAAAFAATALLGPPALAQDAGRLDQARARFEQGEAYFKAELFDKAIAEYQAAYELVPRPGLLFNIGLCHEKLDQLEEAVDHYDRYLRAEPDGRKAAEARARREALNARIADATSAAAERRDAEAARAAGQRALAGGDYDLAIEKLTASYEVLVDPEVIFELAEAYRGKGNPILAATEYRRYLEVATTGAHREEASQRLRELEQAERDRKDPDDTPPPPPRKERGSLVPAIVAYAAAGVATAVGVAFGSSAQGTLDELDDALATGTPPLDTGDPRFDEGRSAATWANVSFAIAGAAAATGTVLLVLALRERPVEPARGSASTVLAPMVGDGQVGLSLGGRW